MSTSKAKLSVLHIILAIRETSAPYNEHCLPWADKRDISLCTFFQSDILTPPSISLYEGNGTVTGFLHRLESALGERTYDVIHVHSPHLGLLFLLATILFRRKSWRSTVITVHDSYQNFKLRNKLMFIPVFALFQRVVCCGRSSYDSFPGFFKILAGSRITYVANGLDLVRVDKIAARLQPPPESRNSFSIVTISRLVEIKNPFTVLGAFEQGWNRDSRLVFIGDGLLMKPLTQKSAALGIAGQVEFTGLIAREKVFEFLLDADLYISASRGEGLPVSVLEAMACGRPVILSDIPPHREIAESVDFIPLVNPDDLDGFAREIRKFGDMSAAQRTEIGTKCRKLVEERFSLPAMHAGYSTVYSDIMGIPNISLHERTA